MRKLMLTLATFFVLVVAPAAANAQGFLFGLVVGGMLFSGNTQYSGAGAIILYSANEEMLRSVPPLEVRLVAYDQCFTGGNDAANKSIGEMFATLTKGRRDKKQTVLQVVRIFSPRDASCAVIWFAYIER